MFQLIVAVISIALVAALAIASIFYGGDAFTKSSKKANVTTLVNQGQQIAGAFQLYKTDTGSSAVSVQGLVDGEYLAQIPNPSKIATGAWAIVDGNAEIAFTTGADKEALCGEDDVATSSIDETGEVYKQNGLCDARDGSATKFFFPL